MYLESLKIYCDVVRHKSFSRGADANHISQSAASQAVRQLEERLGVQLIDRSQRPWVVTPDGKFFFEGVQDILGRYQELEEGVRRRQPTTGSRVHVAAIYSVGLQDMSHYVECFRKELPGADVELEYMHPARVYDTVLNDQADLGLIAYARPGQDFSVVPWRQEEMVFACLPEHRLARRRSLRPEDLEGEELVSFQKDLQIRRALDRFLKAHGVHVKVVAEFDNVATIKQAVEDRAGSAILPEPTLRRDVEKGAIAAVPFSGAELFRPLSIIHRRKRRLGSAVERFIELLRRTNGSSVEGAARGNGTRAPSRVAAKGSRTV